MTFFFFQTTESDPHFSTAVNNSAICSDWLTARQFVGAVNNSAICRGLLIGSKLGYIQEKHPSKKQMYTDMFFLAKWDSAEAITRDLLLDSHCILNTLELRQNMAQAWLFFDSFEIL